MLPFCKINFWIFAATLMIVKTSSRMWSDKTLSFNSSWLKFLEIQTVQICSVMHINIWQPWVCHLKYRMKFTPVLKLGIPGSTSHMHTRNVFITSRSSCFGEVLDCFLPSQHTEHKTCLRVYLWGRRSTSTAHVSCTFLFSNGKHLYIHNDTVRIVFIWLTPSTKHRKQSPAPAKAS